MDKEALNIHAYNLEDIKYAEQNGKKIFVVFKMLSDKSIKNLAKACKACGFSLKGVKKSF